MHFQRLDKRLQEAVKALTSDAEFQKRFNDDEVLNRLDDEKFNPALCFSELCSAAGIPVLIEGEHYSPVKLLQYAYMWCIDSPLAKETGKEVTELDHEFKKEDFYVYATFTDGTDGEVTDFEMKVKGMDAGYYILEFTYNGFTEEGYVKCNLPIYPSDKENADQTGE